MSEILDQTLQCAKEILGAEVLDLKIERAVVGLFFSGVKLQGGAQYRRQKRALSAARSGLRRAA